MSQFSPGEGSIPAINQMNRRAIASQEQATRLAQLEQEKDLTQQEFDLRREELQQRKQLSEKEMQLRNQQFEKTLSAEEKMQEDKQEFAASQNEINQEFQMNLVDKKARKLEEAQERQAEMELAAAEATGEAKEEAEEELAAARQAKREAEQEVENAQIDILANSENSRETFGNLVSKTTRLAEDQQRRLGEFDTVEKNIVNGIGAMFAAESNGTFADFIGVEEAGFGTKRDRLAAGIAGSVGVDAPDSGLLSVDTKAEEFDREFREPTKDRMIDLVVDSAVRNGYAEEAEPAILKSVFSLAGQEDLTPEQTVELESNLQKLYQTVGKDETNHMLLESARNLQSLGGADPTSLAENPAGADSRAAKIADTVSNLGSRLGSTFRTVGVESATTGEKAMGALLNNLNRKMTEMDSLLVEMDEGDVSPVEVERFQRLSNNVVTFVENADPEIANMLGPDLERLIQSRTLTKELEQRAIDARLKSKRLDDELEPLESALNRDAELAGFRARAEYLRDQEGGE